MKRWKLPWRRKRAGRNPERSTPAKPPAPQKTPYTTEQSREVLERLRSLGYLG